jgi:hypothetical protein
MLGSRKIQKKDNPPVLDVLVFFFGGFKSSLSYSVNGSFQGVWVGEEREKKKSFQILQGFSQVPAFSIT